MTKICGRCKEEKLFTCFHKNKSTKDGFQHFCITCSQLQYSATKTERSLYSRNYHITHKRQRTKESEIRRIEKRREILLEQARHRAKRNNLPFSITVEDILIPTVCPVLGISLEINVGKGRTGTSPSLDRFLPELGYVKGNVNIISDRANSLKSNATPEELRRIADWIDANAPKIELVA